MAIPKEHSEGILVKKDGLYRYHWDGGQKIDKVDSLLYWLRELVYVDDDITFEDFFKWVMDDHKLASIIFGSHLGGYLLSDWLSEWNNPDIEDKRDRETEQIDYIDVNWSVTYSSLSPEDGIEEWINVSGVGRTICEDAYGDNEWHDTNFSFSFTPLNEYKHYPFKINEEWKIYDNDIRLKSGSTADEYEDASCVFKSSKAMTVYDVVGGILYDISFYGSPKMREKTSDEVKETYERIKDGTEETVRIDNVDDFLEELRGPSKEDLKILEEEALAKACDKGIKSDEE